MLQRISNDQNDNTLLFYNNNNQGFTQSQNRANNMKHVYPQKRGNVVAVEPYNHNPTKLSQNQDIMNIRNEISNINKINVDTDDNSFALKKKSYGVPSHTSGQSVDHHNEISEPKADLKMDMFQYNSRHVPTNNQSKTNDKLNQVVQMQGSRFNAEILSTNTESLELAKLNKDDQNLFITKANSLFSSSFKSSNAFDQETKTNKDENNTFENTGSEIYMKFKHKNTHIIPSGNLLTPPRKPISSVAPSSFTNSTNVSVISPKVHVVSPSVSLISQFSNVEKDKARPALPPKPAKGSVSVYTDDCKQESSCNENIGTVNAAVADSNPIKAKPLTIKKQPVTEQPKLKSTSIKHPQTTFQQIDTQKQSHINGQNSDLTYMFETNDEPDKSSTANNNEPTDKPEGFRRKRALANENMKIKLARRVSFDPLGKIILLLTCI